jgi:Holliday junction DNA helicase RuvA
MYDHLRGDVIESGPTRVVLRVGGIGFDVEAPTSTTSRLAIGAEAELFTILHVVDSVPSLLGFADQTERLLARRLLSVNGVGKAMTLAILSTYTPTEFAAAVINGDHLALKRVKGVGAKTAERLCLELRDLIAKLDLIEDDAHTEKILPRSSEDAIAALTALGYSDKDASDKVRRAREREPSADTETLVRFVLRG